MGRTVFPVGDSMTKYIGWRQALVQDFQEPDSSWPTRTSLEMLGPMHDPAGGYLARDGATIESLGPEVDAFLAAQPFDIGAMLLGTNNLVGQVGKGSAGALPAITAYAQLLAKFVKASRVPLIITVPPAARDPALSDAFNDGLAAGYNELLSRGYAVLFADTRDMIGVQDIGADGWHPKPDVYPRIAAAVYRTLHNFTAGLRPPARANVAAPRGEGPRDVGLAMSADGGSVASGAGGVVALPLLGWLLYELSKSS